MSAPERDEIGKCHPGFGLFAKAHREFFDALAPDGWRAVVGYSGVEEKTLSGQLDIAARKGALTRVTRWAAGASVVHPVSHLWCEEVFILSGSLAIGEVGTPAKAQILPAGTYACRPADIIHGPFYSPDGCVLLEFIYFPPT